MEPNEVDKPKHDPIQPKLEPKYDKYVRNPKPKVILDLIWPRLTMSAFAPNL